MNNIDATAMLFILTLVGAVFGSFLSFISHRMTSDMSILSAHSQCTMCKHKLKWTNLVPIVSYIMQCGRCSFCKARISKRYILIELGSIAGINIAFYLYPLGLYWVFLYYIYLVMLLMSIIDIEHKIIPDTLQLLLLLMWPVYYKLYYIAPPNPYFSDYALQIITGGLLGCFVYLTGNIVAMFKKKDSIGFGDIKLLCIIGLYLHYSQIAKFMLMMGVFGIIFGLIWRCLRKEDEFPFGPAINLAFFLTLL